MFRILLLSSFNDFDASSKEGCSMGKERNGELELLLRLLSPVFNSKYVVQLFIILSGPRGEPAGIRNSTGDQQNPRRVFRLSCGLSSPSFLRFTPCFFLSRTLRISF